MTFLNADIGKNFFKGRHGSWFTIGRNKVEVRVIISLNWNFIDFFNNPDIKLFRFISHKYVNMRENWAIWCAMLSITNEIVVVPKQMFHLPIVYYFSQELLNLIRL